MEEFQAELAELAEGHRKMEADPKISLNQSLKLGHKNALLHPYQQKLPFQIAGCLSNIITLAYTLPFTYKAKSNNRDAISHSFIFGKYSHAKSKFLPFPLQN